MFGQNENSLTFLGKEFKKTEISEIETGNIIL